MALKSLLSVRKAFLFLFLITALAGKAQLPTFNCYITNDVQISSTVYQFDLYLLSTGTTAFQYAEGQFGITINSAIANGGTLTPSLVSGSTTLTNAAQAPTNTRLQSPILLTNGVYYFNVSPTAPPGSGNGSIISNVNGGCTSPGTRIATFRITNSKAFAGGTQMNHVFNFAVSGTQEPVEVYAYVGGQNTDITANGTFYSYNTAGTCLQNITLQSCLVNATASGTAVTCFGGNNGTATVTASGISSPGYVWSNGKTTQSITLLTAGTYSVTVTDNVGCTGTTSVNISQPAVLIGSPGSTAVTCSGAGNDGSVNISASGGTPSYTYIWNNGTTASAMSGLTAGVYKVTITDSHGCSTSDSSVVSACNHITMSLQNCVQIDQATIQVDLMIESDGGPGSDLRLASVSYGINFNTGILKPGATLTPFYVGNTDPNLLPPGFNFSYPTSPFPNHIRITANAFSGNNTGNTMILGHLYRVGTFTLSSSATLVGNTSPNFVLQDSVVGQKTNTAALVWLATAAAQTSFSVTGTIANNGSGFRSVATACSLILNPCDLTATTSPTTPSCFGSTNGKATVNPISANDYEPWTFLWSNGQTNQTITNLSAGTYLVTVTDDALCTATATANVTQPPILTASSSVVNNVSCHGGSNGSVSVGAIGGTSPYSGTGTFTGLAAGTYTYTVTDAHGCTATTTIAITQPTALSVSANNASPVCSGSPLNLSSTPAGGTIPYSYAWTGPNSFSSTLQNPSIPSSTTAASGTYSLIVTDSKGCSTTTTTTATVNNCNSTVTVKFFIQGYYVTGVGGVMKPVMKNEGVAGATTTQTDTVIIELHKAADTTLAATFKGIVDTSGHIVCTFAGSTIGNSYYIVIKHRNALETWSASGVTISSVTNYDFTTAATQAFGSNMILMEAGKYAIYSGDVTQDGVCDASDFNALATDVRSIAQGYKATDLNGDGVADASDFNLLAVNVRAIISRQRP